ncbi:xanthine dehydrogenase accessory factor [Eilatimonas milleporae]|uniref:Xanthine dehydrogenase accessory factor n=2 Tax=Eilatimonas milleporae TaxID=911205 RepID=A0A3M0CDV0_9PROT|nr:xanthine dehydrogenase accessory factor [Eilatimonas milleporae]
MSLAGMPPGTTPEQPPGALLGGSPVAAREESPGESSVAQTGYDAGANAPDDGDWPHLHALLAAGTPAVLVTIALARGSVPRDAGTRMIVTRDRVSGTIGGGNLELQAIAQANRMLGGPGIPGGDEDGNQAGNQDKDGGDRRVQGRALHYQDYPLGPLLNQCCGGNASLLYERFTPDDAGHIARLVATPAFILSRLSGTDPEKRPVTAAGTEAGTEAGISDAAAPRDGDVPESAVALGENVLTLTESGLGENVLGENILGEGTLAESTLALAESGPLLLMADGQPIGLGGQPRQAAYLLEPAGAARRPLFIFGAGHVGRAVVRALADLPFRITWIDSRAEEFPDHIPANTRKRLLDPVTGDMAAEVAVAPAGAFYLVFTHSHDLDFAVTAAVLARGDARYCGLIGSRTKRTRFVRRFEREEGLSPSDIARLTCPIGIAGIPGKAPAHIAVAVAAELLRLTDGDQV